MSISLTFKELRNKSNRSEENTMNRRKGRSFPKKTKKFFSKYDSFQCHMKVSNVKIKWSIKMPISIFTLIN